MSDRPRGPRAWWFRGRLILWIGAGLSLVVVAPLGAPALALTAIVAWGLWNRPDSPLASSAVAIADLLGALLWVGLVAPSVNVMTLLAAVLATGHAWAGGGVVGAVAGVVGAAVVLTFARLLELTGVATSPDLAVMAAGAVLGGGVGVWSHLQARRRTRLLAGLPVAGAAPDFPLPMWWFRDGVVEAATGAGRQLAADPRPWLRLPPTEGEGEAQLYGRGGPEGQWAWALWRWHDREGGHDVARAVVVVGAADWAGDLAARAEGDTARLLGDLSHELKNPLAILRTSLALVDDEAVPVEDRATLLARAREATERLHATLSVVGELGRLAGGERSAPRWVELLASIEHVARDAGAPGLSVEIDPQAAHVLVEEEGLRRILSNLVRNAAQAMSSGEPIAITVTTTPTHLRVVVRDTGPGLPADCLPLDRALIRASRSGGQGLGLGIAYRTALLMGGRLRHLPSDHGTTFELLLPLLWTECPSTVVPASASRDVGPD